jgi:hypothetical protein
MHLYRCMSPVPALREAAILLFVFPTLYAKDRAKSRQRLHTITIMEMILFGFAIIFLSNVVAQPTYPLNIVGLDGGPGPFLIDETVNISWAGGPGSVLPEYSDL